MLIYTLKLNPLSVIEILAQDRIHVVVVVENLPIEYFSTKIQAQVSLAQLRPLRTEPILCKNFINKLKSLLGIGVL